ncbi:transcriptional repressor [Tichowtungia aerotolerans]|uniref:Transcriptional repressor n=1 Tax=Tichowtungia aerotolerans TaxID=2697043 RepID=A0A6P1M9U2_9BACT|nr:transcriptional repressor [Tichowtungia aerotolerans]QHI68346.1 transcriptional repressor [Tichowtungia aerotolerans]
MRKKSDVQAILKRAEAYCMEQGLRFTDGRAVVLREVVRQRTPVKAYDVLQTISADKARPMPPVVYRALDFWTSHGFLHRIESLNAYTACTHPGCGHDCQIFVCSKCGRVSEICDEKLIEKIGHKAESLGFRIEHLSVEATGSCPDCR